MSDFSKITEDMVLDAIRSNAEPEIIYKFLQHVLVEKYTNRVESKQLEKLPIHTRFFDFVKGTRRYMPGKTEKTLRSADFLLKFDPNLPAIKKLKAVKLHLPYVLSIHPKRGFLYELNRALEIYLNPRKESPWNAILGKSKNTRKYMPKKHRMVEQEDIDDTDDQELNSNDVIEEYDENNEDDEDTEEYKSTSKRKNKTKELKQKKRKIKSLQSEKHVVQTSDEEINEEKQTNQDITTDRKRRTGTKDNIDEAEKMDENSDPDENENDNVEFYEQEQEEDNME